MLRPTERKEQKEKNRFNVVNCEERVVSVHRAVNTKGIPNLKDKLHTKPIWHPRTKCYDVIVPERISLMATDKFLARIG